MSSNVSPSFGTNYPPGAAESLSVALIGPDRTRRRTMATALAENRRANVSEFESYPVRPEEFRWLLEQSFDVIVLDLDSDPDVVLNLVERVRAGNSATIMVYSEQTDTKIAVRYMRAGASEYLLLPLEEGIVSEALDRAAAQLTEKAHPPMAEAAGKLLVFVCAKGGCGVTTLACNLAIALAGNSDQKTLLIDLALPIGDAALALGVTAKYSTDDALRNPDRLDGRFLKDLLVRHKSGVYVLAAPSNIPGGEGRGDAIDKLVAVSRREFDHVIVDVGSRMDLAGTTLFKEASTVYLVTLTGVSELRNSNRLISQFFPAGGPNLEVVINRFESRLLGGVNEDVVTKALGRPVRWKVPEDRETAREMQFGETGEGETRVSRMTQEIAGTITGRAAAQEKKKGFALKGPGRGVAEEASGSDNPLSIKMAPQAAQATPAISWAVPETISYGDSLSSAQLNASASVAGSFVYEPGPGTVLPAGTHKLSVSFTPSDGGNYTTAQATVPITVEKSAPVIAWPKPDTIPYGTALGSAQLCATASVPGKFEYSPAPGMTPAAGTHKLTVKFTPTDTENYAKVQAAVSLTVSKAMPAIAWPVPKPIDSGTRLSGRQLCAMASVPGKFDYSPAPGEVLSAGTHTLFVTFTPTDAENYSSVESSVPLVVDLAKPAISWPKPSTITYGTELNEEQLCATASAPGTFEYSPAAGELLPAGTHTLTVTFTPEDSSKYSSARTTTTLKVLKATPTIEWPSLKPALFGTRLSNAHLCATASVPGEFEYSPAPGVVLAAGTHRLSVNFTPADSANYSSAQASIPLTVVAKAKPLIAWSNPDPISYGTPIGEEQLCATASAQGTFDYSVEPGTVLSAGTHTLTATFTPTDSLSYATAQATVSIRVEKATPAVDWPAPKPILDGTLLSSAQLCATAPMPGRFDYSPLPGVGLPPGTHTLSVLFTPTDRANYAATQVTVPLTVVAKELPEITWPDPAPIPYGTILGSAQLCAKASVPGRFEYFPGAGVELAPGTHTLTAVFTPSDLANYSATEATVSIDVVVKPAPAISWSNPDPIPYGTPLSEEQLCATASVAGTFDYSAGPGEVLAAGTHTLSVTFTPEDSAGYSATRASVTLKVEPATPSIDWPDPQPIRYGTPLSALQLDAAAWVPGTFVYSPAADEILPPGSHTLSVIFTPMDAANYNPTEASVTLKVVDRAMPVITWPKPDPIVYGASLGATQLCATSSVPGTFTYSPARGEVLAPGTHKLSVTFVPADTEKYKPAQATVALQVKALNETARLQPIPVPEEPRTPIEPPVKTSQWLEEEDTASEAAAPDWLKVADAMRSRQVSANAEAEESERGSSKKWVFVAVACVVLAIPLASIPFFHARAKSPAPQETATQLPVAPQQPDTATDVTKPSPSSTSPAAARAQAQTAQPAQQPQQQNQTAATTDSSRPSSAQAALMNDQLNAPSRIQSSAPQSSPNAPPPGTIVAGNMGGNGSLGNVFSEKSGPRIVAAAPPAPSGPLDISSAVAMGLLVHHKAPVYPEIARQARVAGTVQLQVTISKSGTIQSLRVVGGPAMLRQAAMDAVRSWRYRPYVLNNSPIEVRTIVNVNFSLGG